MREKGFTLIEMLMVLTMIGLIAAIAYPRIDVARFKIDAAMRGVGTTLLAAQRTAVTRQHDVVVMFDVPKNHLRVLWDADNDGVVDSDEHVRVLDLGTPVEFGRASANMMLEIGSNAISFTQLVGGMPSLTFHRSGSASEEGGFYITSSRATAYAEFARDTRAVKVERGTGRTSWYRWNPPQWRLGS